MTTEIVEAKIKEKQQSVYATLSGTSSNYDHHDLYQNISTPYTIGEKGAGAIYWASKYEFEHDSQRGPFPDYLEVKLISAGRKDVVLGKTLIPRILLTQEQICGRAWFPCALTEPASGFGSIRFSIFYTPPAAGNKHIILVKIVECKKLTSSIPSMKPSPYCVVSILPDPKGLNISRTTLHANSENPKFNETLTFSDDKFDFDNEISIFVFGQLANELDIHGHVRIPMSIIKPNEKFEREMPLSPIIQLNTDKRTRSSISTLASDNAKHAQMQEKSILKKFHSSDYSNGKIHKWQSQYAPTASSCIFCLGLIPKNSNIKNCAECHGTCHRVCSKYCVNSCGVHTMVQLNFFKEDIPVYKFENYMRFFKNVMSDNFVLVNLIEKNREEAAKSLIKVCDSLNCVHEYICSLLKYEIGQSESLGTLFRNNSMASKSVECYFKYQGMTYLKEILRDPIIEFLKGDLDGELDPTRLDNATEQSPKNLANLMSFCDKLLNAIISKQESFPKPMQGILYDVSRHVLSRFSDPQAAYSAIAGFVFLRYFAPAILGPNLFDITNDFIPEKKKRTLTLAAKTIQNLANLTTFGKKEPFMIPMNQFLEPRILKMTAYLTDISQQAPLREAAYGKKAKKADAEPQLAKVVEIFRDTIERGVKNDEFQNLAAFKDLDESIKELMIPRFIEYDIPTIANSILVENLVAPASPIRDLKPQLMKEDSNVTMKSSGTSDSTTDDLERTMTFNKIDKLELPSVRNSVARKPRPVSIADSEMRSLTIRRGEENTRKQSVDYDLFIPKELTSALMSRAVSTDQILPIESVKNIVAGTSSLTVSDPRQSELSLQVPVGLMSNDVSFIETENNKNSVVVDSRASVADNSKDKRASFIDPSKSRTSQVVFESNSNRTTAISIDKNTFFNKPGGKDLKSLFSVIETAVATANQFDTSFQSTVICHDCKKPTDGDYLVIDGKSFHLDHFKCFVCKKDAKDGAKIFDDKLYCIEHYLEHSKDKVCYRCDMQWTKGDQIVKAVDSLWHATCFTCAVCDCTLNKGFVPHDGLPYCPEHYKRFIGLVCDGCGLVIDNEFIVVNGMKYHKECRSCKVCDQSIANKNYVLMNEHIYCQDHFASVMKCTRCRDSIKDGEYISVPMRDATLLFHEDHFSCEVCNCQLTPKSYFITPSKNVRCRKCIFITE